MNWQVTEPGTGTPKFDNALPDYTPALYANVASLLAKGTPEAPKPSIGYRSDGLGLIYPEAVNIIFGSPEAGKTLAGSAIAADCIFQGGSVLLVDIDHNGAGASISRLRSFGISSDILSDPSRFRYTAPDDSTSMLAVVAEAQLWKPTFVLVDSVGELMPMFGANSNLPDDYTRVHRAVLTAFAKAGSAVLAVDHEAKGESSREYGASGTAAKKRAVDGVMLRARMSKPFSPGQGGKSKLLIVKDRHGGLRASSPVGDREPIACTFELMPGEASTWKFWAPLDGETDKFDVLASDIKTLKELDPPPTSIRDVKVRCSWGQERAKQALDAFREIQVSEMLPSTPPVGVEYTRAPSSIPEYTQSAPEVHEYTDEEPF